MYTPVGSNQNQAQQLNVQAQGATQSGQGVAAAIRAADASLQNKKNEARRIYERSQKMMREDLDTVAGFDVSLAGADAAPALRAAADKLREDIRNANDPVEAQKLIGDFRQNYNMLKTRETNRAEDANQLNTMSTATGQQMAGFNQALPPGVEYEEVDAGTVARADQAFKKDFQFVDGKMMVMGPEGNLVPLDQADFINDTSMYQPPQRKADVGDLQTSAQAEALQNRIKARGGGVFKEKFAEMEYDTLAENSQRQGTVLRMQINEDYLDESGNSQFFDNPQQAKAFELGPNAFSRVENDPDLAAAWRDVWGEPGSAREKDDSGNIVAQGTGWDLLNQERPKFVEYARFATSSEEKLRRQRLADANKTAPSRYAYNSLAVNTEQRAEDAVKEGLGVVDNAPGYQMVAFINPKNGDSDPIEIQGSSYFGLQEDGKYLVQGFGVDPLYGINRDGSNIQRGSEGQMMASVTVESKTFQYKGPSGTISQEEYEALEPEFRTGYTQQEVKTTEQKRIKIGEDASPEGVAIYNRIIRDPEAVGLMNRQRTEAMAARADYLAALGTANQRKAEEEAELQAIADQQAEDAAFEEQKRLAEAANEAQNKKRRRKSRMETERIRERWEKVSTEKEDARREFLQSLAREDAEELGIMDDWKKANRKGAGNAPKPSRGTGSGPGGSPEATATPPSI